MEFKVGSLANLISGTKSPSASKKSKLFENAGEGKEVNIKFQNVHKSTKEKGKRKATEDDSSVKRKKSKQIM
jgi:hypothetical protein